MLAVIDLHKAYKKEPVLQGVSFNIPTGILGIYGSNGAGKTTLLHILAAVLKPDSGRVFLSGTSFSDRRHYSKMVGFVPQSTALSPRLTVKQNLDFWAAMYGYAGRARRQAVIVAAQLANVTSFLNKPVGKCSGGMAKRANLAAGIIGLPRLILLDEPTAGLDAANRDLVLQAVRQLRDNGCIVIMVNHYKDELASVCDQIILLQDGQAVVQDA